MTATPIELIRDVDGEPMLTMDALSLMFGVGVELITAHTRRTFAEGHVVFPAAWLRAGRRRASEAAAATGSRDVLDVLTYWARRDHGAEIVLVDGAP